MKIQYLSLAIAIGVSACNAPKPSATSSSTPAMEKPASTTTTMGDAAYTTQVLKADLPSPRKEMTAALSGASLTVNYGSPAVKGRNLWGELVPYDKVWRAGANEATTFTTSADIMVEGQRLPAGKYGFFTIPGETEWTIIFNSTADQWGAYNYDAKKDVLRVKIKPRTVSDASENLEYKVAGKQVLLHWGTLQAGFSITGG